MAKRATQSKTIEAEFDGPRADFINRLIRSVEDGDMTDATARANVANLSRVLTPEDSARLRNRIETILARSR